MYSRCTHCHTACAVPAETLVHNRGEQRCAACGKNFDALLNLTRTPPDDLHAATPAVAPIDSAAIPGQAALTLQFSATDTEAAQTAALGDDAPADAETPAAEDDADDLLPMSGQRAVERPLSAAEDADEIDAMGPSADAAIVTSDDAETDPEPPPFELQSRASSPHWFDPALESAHLEDDDADESAHPYADTPVPRFVSDPTRAPPAVAGERRWPRRLLVAVLAVLLLVQCIVAERDTLAAHAQSRPWLEYACAGLGCSLPAWHDPTAMDVMTRDVRPHPSVPNALLISASFRNEARWAQAWPGLQLTLSDLDGQPIAQRRFLPAEYLGLGAPVQLIQPDQTASITLEVRDPGKQAVAFEFEFF